MRTIEAIALVAILTGASSSLAQGTRIAPPAARRALTIVIHLDLSSFPNSTGPRRRPSAHTPADYGLIDAQGFPDGWAQVSERDESWHMGALVLDENNRTATICFTDSASRDGTYHSTQVLRVTLGHDALWRASVLPERPECRNAPDAAQTSSGTAAFAPAVLLDRLDDFRDGLSPSDRRRLDGVLVRSTNGGSVQCERAERSMASCEVAAYMAALRRTGLEPLFLATLTPPVRH